MKTAYQAIVDEVSRTEKEIVALKTLLNESMEKLPSLNESVHELKAKATSFREQKVEAEVSAPAL